MDAYIGAARSLLHRVLGAGKGAAGSLAYRNNSGAIWRGEVPVKYTRLLDLVPGERVLELGAAEGVLALLLAQRKQKVLALELKQHRHEEALRLQAFWQQSGRDVARCEMVLGNIKDRFDLLAAVDTLVAVRSIYHLREDIDLVFDAVGRQVKNVVLCGNRLRAQHYREGTPSTNGDGDFNYFASLEGMSALLEDRGYSIVRTIAEGDPIVIGVKVK
jgi:SAM-dependent methyltransferase